MKTDGTVEKVATDLGVACGLAFAPDGTMFVGDRSGTLFRVNAAGRVDPFATLPPSVAAFHLAIGPRRGGLRQRPDARRPATGVSRGPPGEVSVFAEGFGRPQGLAVDAGRHAVCRRRAGGRERHLPGAARAAAASWWWRATGVIGLALHPERGVAVVSSDTAYRFDRW